MVCYNAFVPRPVCYSAFPRYCYAEISHNAGSFRETCFKGISLIANIRISRYPSYSLDHEFKYEFMRTCCSGVSFSSDILKILFKKIFTLTIHFLSLKSDFPGQNFTLPALTIALLYQSCWQIELFFKWIKQNLRLKAFYVTSENLIKPEYGLPSLYM